MKQRTEGQGTMGQETFGQRPIRQGPMAQGTMGQGPTGQGTMGQWTFGHGPMGQGPIMGQGTDQAGSFVFGSMGQGIFGQGSMGQGIFVQGPMGPGIFGQGSMGPGTFVQGPVGPGIFGQGTTMGPGTLLQGSIAEGPSGLGIFGPKEVALQHSELKKDTLELGKWNCSYCTFLNDPLYLICQICENKRVSQNLIEERFGWDCPLCTRFNTSTATKCETCDYELLKELPEIREIEEILDPEPKNTIPDNVVRGIYGATPQPCGKKVFFRVWARNALRVYVIGSFSNWKDKIPLFKTNYGYFENLVDAKVGDTYKYIVHIKKQSKFEELWRDDPRSPLFSYSKDKRNSVVLDMKNFVWTDQKFTSPKFSELVLYEMHIGTFGASDGSSNGTFLSCIPRLDHLQRLGINAIEIMPLNQDAHSKCWGYDPISLFAIHSQFGSPNDLKELVDEAHKRGIAVILDWVPNHMGARSVLENFSCSDNREHLGEYFYYEPDNRKTDYGPRLCYKSNEVRKLLLDSLRMWLCDYHFDGIRVDSTNTMRKSNTNQHLVEAWSLLQEVNNMVKRDFPNCICIAEDLQDNLEINMIAGFHSQWDSHFFATIYTILTDGQDKCRDTGALCSAISKKFLNNSFSRVIYTENHDTIPENRQSRIPLKISSDDPKGFYAAKRSLLGISLLLTAIGMPMLLQGQENLEISSSNWPIPPLMDWKNMNPKFFYAVRILVHLRRNIPLPNAKTLNIPNVGVSKGLTGPNLIIFHENKHDGIIAFRRFKYGGPRDDIVVIVNLQNKQYPHYAIGFPHPGKWTVVFNSDSKEFGDNFDGVGVTQIEAKEKEYDHHFWSGSFPLGRYAVMIMAKV